MAVSTVEYLDLSSRPGQCGYCKGNESVSQGMFLDKLTLDDYQDLLDQGWRRSGRCNLHAPSSAIWDYFPIRRIVLSSEEIPQCQTAKYIPTITHLCFNS